MTFDEAYDMMPATGWLTRNEAEVLWRHALKASGSVLETGVYFGRSATLLATAIKNRLEIARGPLHLCDPYDDGHHFRTEDRALALRAQQSVLDGMKRVGGQMPHTHIMTEEDFYKSSDRPATFGFIYLDGHAKDCTHTKEAIERWVPLSTGPIAIHDYMENGDGRAVYDAVATTSGLVIIERSVEPDGSPGKLVICNYTR